MPIQLNATRFVDMSIYARLNRMKTKKFLLTLYRLQSNPTDYVHSVDIENALGLTFNQVSRLSSHWESIKVVSHLSERGGLSTTYRLTDKGLKLAKKYQQQDTIKKISIGLLVLIAIIILTLTKG